MGWAKAAGSNRSLKVLLHWLHDEGSPAASESCSGWRTRAEAVLVPGVTIVAGCAERQTAQ
jgi:hypothetical protein